MRTFDQVFEYNLYVLQGSFEIIIASWGRFSSFMEGNWWHFYTRRILVPIVVGVCITVFTRFLIGCFDTRQGGCGFC